MCAIQTVPVRSIRCPCSNPGNLGHLHAGSLQDSGHVAAAAYSLLGGSAAAAGGDSDRPLRVLLLGTNHFTNEPAAGLSSAAAWRTPLGDVPVDAGLSAALAGAGLPVADGPHKCAAAAGRC